MNKKLTLAIGTGILAPFFASAQLVDVTDLAAGTFFDTISAMNADVLALQDEGDALARDASTIYWTGTTFESTGGAGDLKLVDVTPIQPFFRMTGDFSIGYLGNESGDDNELWMTAYDSNTAPTLSEVFKLYDYDADDPNSTDDPPMADLVNLEAGVDKAFIQFTHKNEGPKPANISQANQDDPIRFKVYREQDENGNFGLNYLFAIADRDTTFDADRDDGFFFLSGNIVPVPEPSQIAALALLGLGGFLYVRRRFSKKQK